MNEIQSTKSILAKLLASENITVEHGNYQTASFDVKNRVIRLPIFKYMSGSIYDLMVLHEVGHALWTPLKGLHSEKNEKGPGFKSYLNVVEDARIEKKIKRKYPGGSKPMIEGYRQLVSENFFATKDRDLNALNLIDRINLHYKIGASAGIEFNEIERPFITEIDNAETFDEIYDITVRLFEYSKENESQTDFQDFSEVEYSIEDLDDCEDMPDVMGDSPLDFMEEEEEERNDAKSGMRGNSLEEEEESSAEETDSTSSENCEDASSGGDGEDENEERNKETGGQITSGLEGAVSNEDPFEPKSVTDEAWQESAKDLNEESERIWEYVTIPKANLKEIIVPHKELYAMTRDFFNDSRYEEDHYSEMFAAAQNMVKEFKRKNSKTVDYLVKEFEMRKRADEYKRTSVSKTGLLDMSSIHSYKYNDNLFKKVATIASGKNHGLVLFIDWSGSMHSNLAGTIDQLLNLVLFCKKVNIPFDVYAFTDRNIKSVRGDDGMPTEGTESEQTKQKNKVFFQQEGHMASNSTLHLMNLFSSSMTTSEMNYAMQNMMQLKMKYDTESFYGFRYSIPYHFELGGTPLDATIITALEVIPDFQKKNHVQIVNAVFLTDGESHSNTQVWKSNSEGILNKEYFDSRGKDTYYVDPVSKKTYSSKGRRSGISTTTFYTILKDRCNVNILGFFLTGRRFKYISADISWGTKNAPSPNDIFKLWKKEKSYVASNYLGYDKLYYIKDGGDLNVENEDFVVKEDASKSQLTKAFKTFNKKKLTNRIVLKSFAEMVA